MYVGGPPQMLSSQSILTRNNKSKQFQTIKENSDLDTKS